MTYTYAIESAAAQIVFGASTRERRFLHSAIQQIAANPFHVGDLQEKSGSGRTLLTRFFGPYAITYWVDHAATEVRIALIYRD